MTHNERKIIEDWESRFDVRFSWGKDDYEWTTKTNVTPRMVKIEVEGLLQKQAELSYAQALDDAVEVVTNHIMDAEGWIPFEKLDVLRQELQSLKKTL